jgi:hypothetical protein
MAMESMEKKFQIMLKHSLDRELKKKLKLSLIKLRISKELLILMKLKKLLLLALSKQAKVCKMGQGLTYISVEAPVYQFLS